MEKSYEKAYKSLKKLGVPVIEGGYHGEDTFRISGEDNYPIIWADYYCERHGTTLDDFGVNHEINDTLEANGLYAEWQNPGVLSVQKL